MYLNEKMQKFLDDLGARTPTPGGGSVTALTGAIGAGLISMVCNFTLGKEKYKKVEKEIRDILTEVLKTKETLSNLIETDIKVYEKVATAFKLPKMQDEEKRKKAIEVNLKEAIEVPMKVISNAFRLLIFSHKLIDIANKDLITDLGIAALLADNTIKSAIFNVKVNLISLKDEEYKQRILDTITPLLKESADIRKKIEEKVNKQLEE